MYKGVRIPEPVLITGTPMSGCSLVAGILYYCDIKGGVLDNPGENKCNFENQELKHLVSNVFILNKLDPQTFQSIPKQFFTLPQDFKRQCFDIMKKQGVSEKWFYKDVRLSLIWKPLNYCFSDARWVYVTRGKEDIMKACENNSFLDFFKFGKPIYHNDREFLLKRLENYVDCYIEKGVELRFACNHVKVVHLEKIKQYDFRELKEVVEWCGGVWNEKHVKSYVKKRINKY